MVQQSETIEQIIQLLRVTIARATYERCKRRMGDRRENGAMERVGYHGIRMLEVGEHLKGRAIHEAITDTLHPTDVEYLEVALIRVGAHGGALLGREAARVAVCNHVAVFVNLGGNQPALAKIVVGEHRVQVEGRRFTRQGLNNGTRVGVAGRDGVEALEVACDLVALAVTVKLVERGVAEGGGVGHLASGARPSAEKRGCEAHISVVLHAVENFVATDDQEVEVGVKVGLLSDAEHRVEALGVGAFVADEGELVPERGVVAEYLKDLLRLAGDALLR